MRFAPYLMAGYPCLWVCTLEPDRAESVLRQVALETNETPAYRWDMALGMVNLEDGEATECSSPVAALKQAAEHPAGTVTFLWNFHLLLSTLQVIQNLQNSVPALQAAGNTIVVLAPDSEKLPPELARLFTVLDFELPDETALRGILAGVVEGSDGPPPPDDQVAAAVEACRGLTATEAQDALALALSETGRFDPQLIADVKANALLRQTQLQVNRYPDRFADLGGLDVLKDWTLTTAPSALSLGILIVGVSGGGKSSLAKALGNELGWTCLSLDFGRMMGSLVGQSEARIRQALESVEAMGRCILFIDEIEKGLAGVQPSSQSDSSGVKAGVGATFLKWLSDREPGRTYVVATSNAIDMLPTEYKRAERWDGIFFVDLPNLAERAAIWEIHMRTFLPFLSMKAADLPDDTGWTGAEIKGCCRTAAMRNCSLQEAATYVNPVAVADKDAIDGLRRWAIGRAVPASTPEPTAAETALKGRQARRVRRSA